MRNNEPNVSLRSGIAPLQRRAFVGSRRAARPVRAAAGPNGTPNTWAPSSNRRSYSPNGGNLGNVRDLYEGATGLDVLAMQKDLVAEGFLGRQHATGYVTSEIFPHLSTTTARACLASPIPVPACPHARAFPRTAGESPRSLSSSQTNLNVGRTRPRNLVPTISPRSVFTTATRSAVEKLQQQYGLPMTGIWGSLERGVFDTNARVLTAPPASAAALLPPDYNRTTSNVYAKAVGAVPAAAPAPAKAATSSGAVAIPGDVTGIAVCASAGFLTAAVVSKASAARRARALQPPAPARRRRRLRL